MSAHAAIRGQPLQVFAMILGVWLVARVLLWESPFPLLARSAAPGPPERDARQTVVTLPATRAVPESRMLTAAAGTRPEPLAFAAPPMPPYPAAVVESPVESGWHAGTGARLPAAAPASAPPRRAAGHHLLLAAAFAHLELPREVARFYEHSGDPVAPASAPARLAAADRFLLGPRPAGNEPAGKRWSGDGWLLWRDGSAAAAAPGIAAYGRSQAGAVLRYHLAAASPARPTLYARVTSALQRPEQAEAAAGLALRPLPRVPVSVAAEARVTDTDGGRRAGSAVFAVTELPPVALPFGLRGEAYAQAGYVSGRYETAFVDGQVRADRRIVRIGGRDELRAGLAAWGGAQEGAARLDVGPSATVGFRLGETQSRLAVDYRVRVAGQAAPASGAAVTFSAGF